jgi:Family of unknown function (DUF6495)
MKYRRLNSNELADLESEFVRFLIANGIDAAHWTRMKTQQIQEALKMIDIFSDMVFETSLKKVKYLKARSTSDLKLFHCQPNQIELIALEAKPKSSFDFTKDVELRTLLSALTDAADDKLTVYKAQKNYQNDRERALFELMEDGCLICDGHLFEMLNKAF